jgi:hypothetical protein
VVARAEQEPTLSEIAVALRETRRSASRIAPFSVIDGQPGHRGPDAARAGADSRIPGRPAAHAGPSGFIGIAELRAEEIQRLLAENGRLNDRITYLLEVIEHEPARAAEREAERVANHLATATDRGGIAGEVREAVEAELRPVLLVLLRLLEKKQTGTAPGSVAAAAQPARGTMQRAARPAMPASGDAGNDGIIDLDASVR